jgi:hypothetical protein
MGYANSSNICWEKDREVLQRSHAEWQVNTAFSNGLVCGQLHKETFICCDSIMNKQADVDKMVMRSQAHSGLVLAPHFRVCYLSTEQGGRF